MTEPDPPARESRAIAVGSALGSRPAAAVITECLRAQSAVPRRSALARFFGRSPLSEDSRPWYLGALGELAVAERLSALGPEWTILHSLPVGTRGSDIDHLLIGPGGVFTVNSKYHDGANVWLGSHRLLVNGQKTDHLRNARYEATRVAKMLARETGSEVSATGIVVLVGIRRITVKSRPDDVAVLRDSALLRWLRKRPASLRPEQHARLRSIAASPALWGSGVTAPDFDAFESLQRTVRQAHRVRLAWATASFLLLLVTLTAAIFALPSLL